MHIYTHIAELIIILNVTICSFIYILIHTKGVNHAKDLCV